MAWFKKKDKVVDLGKKYKERQAAQKQARAQMQDSQTQNMAQTTTSSTNTGSTSASQGNTAGFGIFDSGTNQTSTNNDASSDFVNISDTMEGRRKRLAKRIMEMTSKMENLSNQVYHLQQRIEVLERKLDVGRY